MTLLEKHRAKMFTEFSRLLGEETAQAMMAEYPARNVDEPVTRSDLALTRAELELSIARVVDELTKRMITIAGLQIAAVGTFYAFVH